MFAAPIIAALSEILSATFNIFSLYGIVTFAPTKPSRGKDRICFSKFIGSISGEIVTVAIHEFCQDTLNLSDTNIALFKKALAGGYLGNVGPQVKYGTEFTANRWDKYITCVGSLGN